MNTPTPQPARTAEEIARELSNQWYPGTNQGMVRESLCSCILAAIHEAQPRIAQLEAQVTALTEALGGIMELIESGVLVRDVSRDAEPGWAIKQLPLLKALSTARSAMQEQKRITALEQKGKRDE